MYCLVASPGNKWFVTTSYDGTSIIWDAGRHTIVHQWLAHCGPIQALGISPDGRRIISAGSRLSGEALTIWDINNGVSKVAALAFVDPKKRQETAVSACAWSPDGALIASARLDATVCIWDAFTFQQLSATDPEASFSFPSGLQWFSDSRCLAWYYARGGNEEWAIWDPSRGEPPKRFPSHQTHPRDFRIRTLSFHPRSKHVAVALRRHGIAVNSGPSADVSVWGGISDEHSGCVAVWDIVSGTTLVVLGHDRAVVDVSFSPDGHSLMSVSEDGSVKIWDTESWQETASLNGGGGECSGACFSTDGEYIAAISNSSDTRTFAVRLWRVGEASCAIAFAEHKWNVRELAFSPDGEFLASGDGEGIVHIRRLSRFIGH